VPVVCLSEGLNIVLGTWLLMPTVSLFRCDWWSAVYSTCYYGDWKNSPASEMQYEAANILNI